MTNQEQLENYGVYFTPVSSLELRVSFPNSSYKLGNINKPQGDFDYIEYQGVKIKKGDRFFKNVRLGELETTINYKANYIVQTKNQNHFSLVESFYNKAVLFVLPFVFPSRNLASFVQFNDGKYNGYLINCYLSSPVVDKINDDSILLLLKFSKSSRFKAQEKHFFENELFIRHIDVDENYVLYEFKIKKKYIPDYRLLMDGKYSEISSSGKKAIANFHEDTIEGAYTNSILERNPDMVKQYEKSLDVDMTGVELASKFNEEEILAVDSL